jgi:hypothetical protein
MALYLRVWSSRMIGVDLVPHSCPASGSVSLSRVRRYISRLDAPDDNRNAVQYRFTLPLKV